MWFVRLVSRLPFWFWYGVSDIMFIFVYYVFGYRKRVVSDNLALAFPEMTQSELKNTIRGFYQNFTDVMVETIKAITISKEAILHRVEVINPELVLACRKDYKGVILMGSHNANWEYMQLSVSAAFTIQLFGVYKKLNNRKIDALMSTMRGKFGSIPVEMEDAIATVKSMNEFSAIGLIADQSPQRRKKNLFMEFFGHSVPVYRGPVLMAKLFNLPVLYIGMKRTKRGFYELSFQEIAFPPYQQPDEEIMRKYIRILEEEIREHPEAYLWSHNRWKHAVDPLEKNTESI